MVSDKMRVGVAEDIFNPWLITVLKQMNLEPAAVEAHEAYMTHCLKFVMAVFGNIECGDTHHTFMVFLFFHW